MAVPVLQYLVAFQNNAMDDPNLITSVASPPGALGANNVWTDITNKVMNDSGVRGREHELQQFEAGTRQLTLYNADGRFTPGNTSGIYNPYVTIRRPFQVRCTWSGTTYYRFTGQVDSWGTSWPDASQQMTTLHVTDAFRMFNLADITSAGYPTQVITDGATAYWRLGDPVGSATAVDSGSSHYNGTYRGSPQLGQAGAMLANPGTSVDFANPDPTPAGYVTVPAGSAPTGTVYTIEAFVYSTNWTLIGDSMIYQWTDSSFDVGLLWIAANMTVQFSAYNVGSGLLLSVETPVSAIATNQWVHIVATRNGATCAIYVDGVAQSLTVTSAANPGAFTAGSAWIGWDGAPIFPGLMQEVAVYNGTALTSTQAANHYALATWPQQRTDQRIAQVLTAVGWASTATALDTGKSTVQADTAVLTSTSSLSHMQSCEATEGGALFMTVDGKVRFWSRPTLQSASWTTTNQAVFGDNTGGGDIPFQPAPTLAADDIDLYNEAVATRTGGNTQIVDNTTSIAQYGRNTWNPPSELIGISDAEVLAMCQYVVAKYATPVNRLGAVTIDMISVANAFPSLVPSLLNLEVLYQVTVERTVIPGGGAAFSQTADIEQITETIDPTQGVWTITFGMEISDPVWWVIGTSQLGTTTRLAW